MLTAASARGKGNDCDDIIHFLANTFIAINRARQNATKPCMLDKSTKKRQLVQLLMRPESQLQAGALLALAEMLEKCMEAIRSWHVFFQCQHPSATT